MRARLLVVPLLAAAGFAATSACAQYDSFGYVYGYSTPSSVAEQLRREREMSEWRLVITSRLEFRTAFKRPSFEPAPVGPTTWRAQNENPWANAYGTPSTQGFASSGVQRHQQGACACYIPSDAKSWDGGPLTQADIARRCAQQCN